MSPSFLVCHSAVIDSTFLSPLFVLLRSPITHSVRHLSVNGPFS